ncbi:MAG: hypothetical protein R3B82_19140 [Sandaracinaceae bacterium]
MPAAFASERARGQLARILAHVGFPGLAVVLDRDGFVVGASGGVAAATADDIAATFGARRDAAIHARAAVLGDAYQVHGRELLGGHRLVVVLPAEVTVRMDRLERATDLLARMLVAGAAVSGGSSGAPALVGLASVASDDVSSRGVAAPALGARR